MKARTIGQVIAAEAGGKTPAEREADMKQIATTIANRAMRTGQTPEAIVSEQSQYNAYGEDMPAGTPALVGLAERAWQAIQVNGPINNATYYAMPAATKHLPSGLTRLGKTKHGHIAYDDPKSRPIKTAVGTKHMTPLSRLSGLPQTVNVAPRSRPSRIAPATPGINVGSIAAKGGLKAFLDSIAPGPLGLQRPAVDITSNFPGMSVPADTASPRTMAKLGGIAAALTRSPASTFAARPERVAPNAMRPSVDIATTPEAGDRLSMAQMAAPSSFPGRPAGPLGLAPSKKEGRLGTGLFTVAAPQAERFNPSGPAMQNRPASQNHVASFTPTGPMNNDVYTPSTPSSVTPDAGYADPMQVAAAKEWGAKQAATVDPNTPDTYAQQGEDRARYQAEKAARREQERQIAAATPKSIEEQAYAANPKSTAFADMAAAVHPATPTSTVAAAQPDVAPTKTYTPPDLGLKDGTKIAGFNLENALAQIAEDPNLQKQAVAENVVAPPVAAPVAPPVQQIVQPVRQAVRRQIAVTRPASVAPTMSGLTFGNITPSERFSVGSINDAMGGLRGATAKSKSDPSVSYTSSGPTLGGFRRNERFGFVQPVDASGATIGGIKYDDGKSAWSHALGSIFGGADKDKGGGKSSGKSSSGKSGGKGAFGGSTHSSNSVT